jgi:hypothetical protein
MTTAMIDAYKLMLKECGADIDTVNVFQIHGIRRGVHVFFHNKAKKNAAVTVSAGFVSCFKCAECLNGKPTECKNTHITGSLEDIRLTNGPSVPIAQPVASEPAPAASLPSILNEAGVTQDATYAVPRKGDSIVMTYKDTAGPDAGPRIYEVRKVVGPVNANTTGRYAKENKEAAAAGCTHWIQGLGREGHQSLTLTEERFGLLSGTPDDKSGRWVFAKSNDNDDDGDSSSSSSSDNDDSSPEEEEEDARGEQREARVVVFLQYECKKKDWPRTTGLA